MKNSAMNLFVVGASGYLGGCLLRCSPPSVNMIGISSSSKTGTVQLDLLSPHEFDYSIVGTNGVVLLTAAISRPDICAREHERAWAVNVTGTSEFIGNVIARGGRVVFFSSDTVYGERRRNLTSALLASLPASMP